MTTTARPLRRDAQRNRQRILDAAGETFAEVGLGVSLDEIARRAGVGVGTVYRRFPTKDDLIEALFEERIGQVAAAAEAALEEDDGWEALIGFMERALALQRADRGLRQLLLGAAGGHERVARARATIKPIVERLVARAQAQGVLRPDLVALDMPLLLFMLDGVAEYTRDADPDVWRRCLTIVLDGLRDRRDGPTPLPAEPLDVRGLEAIMRAWRA
jgi:AcrR family transcriptional regulator